MKLKIEFELNINQKNIDRALEQKSEEEILENGFAYIAEKLMTSFDIAGRQDIKKINMSIVEENNLMFV